MPQSANEWIDSASIAPDPVITAATVLVIAIPRFASKAKRMDFTEEFSCDIVETNDLDFNPIRLN